MSYTTYQEIRDDLGVYVDGKQINQKNWSYSWSIGDMNIRVHDTSLTNSRKIVKALFHLLYMKKKIIKSFLH